MGTKPEKCDRWLAGSTVLRKLQTFSHQVMDESPYSAQEKQFWGSRVSFTEVLILPVKIGLVYNILLATANTSERFTP